MPYESFHRWHRGDGRQPWCKSCRKEYDADYHRRTREQRQRRRAERKRTFDAWYRALKEGQPCADCGRSYPAPVMQWDHLPGVEKLGELSNIRHTLCRSRVIEEIAKCELVCSNCHALRTMDRRVGGA